MHIQSNLQSYFAKIKIPDPNSHKGQNGKTLIIGGSELFHAASKWSLDTASKFVDMVFYASQPQNNELVAQAMAQEAKQHFWNGIVVQQHYISDYIHEADSVLIGPGMDRSDQTAQITQTLLTKYPNKKWVIDAGALQMVYPTDIPATGILTPHQQELDRLLENGFDLDAAVGRGITVVVKGKEDTVYSRELPGASKIQITGGNAGMTKGGTGDVLSGLIAALYATHDALTATVVGSYANKLAGDTLYSRVGPYFNASDLVQEVPKVLWNLVSLKKSRVSKN